MKIDSIQEIMEIYTEVTKITTTCLDNFHRKPPLFIKGLDFATLIEYMEYEEVINFLEKKNKQLSDLEKNGFHTFYTKNNFIYNILLLKFSKDISVELIAGPILKFMPNNNSIDEKIKSIGYPPNKKYELLEILNNIPLVSNECIYNRGKLLFILCKMQTMNLDAPLQEIHRRNNTNNDLYISEYYDGIDSEDDVNELQDLYKFHVNLMYYVLHGNVNGTLDLIGEYGYLFWNMKTLGNNYRLLKNRCIVTCTMACHYAIQANVPYNRMFHFLSKSIAKLERLTKVSDIILTMSATVEGYAHSVAVLSFNHYSLHINRVLQYIRIHYAEKITLQQLAEYIHVNPVYLSSLIKKDTNMSLSNHINLIRIEESKNLLANTNKSIQEVAYAVGYNYQNHFNSVFKKLEGITPLEYRRNWGDKNFTK